MPPAQFAVALLLAASSSGGAAYAEPLVGAPREAEPPRSLQGSHYDYPPGHRCRSRKWHPRPAASSPSCTNTVDSYPAYWDTEEMEGVTMFATPELCCEKLQSSGMLNADECEVREAEECGAPGQEDGGGSVEDCESGKQWHASKTRAETCTNDDDHPPQWHDDYYLGKTMFLTSDECCASLLSLGAANCQLLNACTDPIYTSGEGSSCSYPWHPSVPDFQGCSNSPPGSYPNDWTASPETTEQYLYATHEECCVGFFDYPEGECPKADHCASEECGEGQKWHRGTEERTCTNDSDYPYAWTDPEVSHKHLFETPFECCAQFGMEGTCSVVDICGLANMEIELDSLPTTVTGTTAAAGTEAESTAASNVADPDCDGMPRKQCRQATGCAWNHVERSCINPGQSENGQPADNGCGALRRRACGQSSQCTWDAARRSCQGPASSEADQASAGQCDGRKFHPTNAIERKCSNDDVYPSTWEDDEDRFFFDRGSDCCEAFYGGPCEVVSVCSEDD